LHRGSTAARHQQDLRIDDLRPRERDALLLPARELVRHPCGERVELDQGEAFATRSTDSARGAPRIVRPNATFRATLLCGKIA
jgi:hypothetical protein